MKNGSMFSGLTEYKQQEFYDSHSVALLLTPDKNYEMELFAGYVASVQDKAWELLSPQTQILQSGWIRQKNAPALPAELLRQSQTGS